MEEGREREHFGGACRWSAVMEERHQTPRAREGLRRMKNYRKLVSKQKHTTAVTGGGGGVLPVHIDGIACFVRENKRNESQRLWCRGELLAVWEAELRK
jgi:hypothetical protein